MHRALIACTTILVLRLPAAPVFAHEGHEHEPAPVPTRITPRGEAQSDALELVAVTEGNTLAVYLDRFASNQSIGQASIEVETPTGPVTASPADDGVFRIAAPWLAKPGKYDLIFTVTVDGDVDALPVTLEIPDAATAGPGTVTGERRQVTRQVAHLVAASATGFVLALAFMAAAHRRPRAAIVAALVDLMLGTAGALAHDGEDHGPAPSQPVGRDLSQRLPDGSLFVPKPTQRILAIQTAITTDGRFRRAIELPGRIIP